MKSRRHPTGQAACRLQPVKYFDKLEIAWIRHLLVDFANSPNLTTCQDGQVSRIPPGMRADVVMSAMAQ